MTKYDHRNGVHVREVRMFGSLGLPELLILLAIVVLIFGVNKLPRLGKGLGEGIRNFKESVRTEKTDPEKNENTKADSDSA